MADAMNLTRLDYRHAYSYQRVAVAFAYDKSYYCCYLSRALVAKF